MFRFLLHRPVAVGMSFLAIAILGVLAYLNLPVSLMPDASVPRLRVEVAYPEGSPLYIEQSILRPLRSAFQGLYQIERIESISASGTGQLELSFSFGTNMRLAYIEVNEKMDQAMSSLPREVDRPVVKRSESTDIPLARLQLTSETYSRQELSDLGRFVVRRRLEQIEGVSLVEMNGGEKRVFRIIPNTVTMATLGISLDKMIQSLVAANTTLNQIKVREGIYEFDITFDNLLADPENLKRVQVYSQSGDAVPLESV
ncbi:MAG: efflux RND transporter permease subunit, partial [Cyclobacteriaceae bacterium]|nr:efflux RND transporter permease subunit [Cyclobacteriaceae bacterium]